MVVSGDTRERQGGPADSVHEALVRLRRVAGLVSACLVEPDSGHVLDTVLGDAAAPGAAAEDVIRS